MCPLAPDSNPARQVQQVQAGLSRCCSSGMQAPVVIKVKAIRQVLHHATTCTDHRLCRRKCRARVSAALSSKPMSLLPPSKACTFPCTLPYVTSWTRPCACLRIIPCTFPCVCLRGVLLGSISSCVEKHKTGAYYARYPPESKN